MRDYSALKVVIDANINRNGRQAITGSILNSVLTAMIDSLGGGYLFMGMASPTTDPGNIDAKVFYLAVVPGRYEHMGNVVIGDGEVAIINHTEGAWTKVTTGIASHDDIEDIKDELESLFGDIAGISTELGNKMTFCELWSDGNIITMKDSETPLTFTEVKGMVDDPSLFVALKLGLIWWLLPQYDDMGGAIVFTGTSLLSAQGSVDRVAINMENRVSSYSIAIENAFLKTDDLEKEKIDNFNTYPTTHAVNAGLEGKQDIISDLETIRTEIKKVGQLELKVGQEFGVTKNTTFVNGWNYIPELDGLVGTIKLKVITQNVTACQFRNGSSSVGINITIGKETEISLNGGTQSRFYVTLASGVASTPASLEWWGLASAKEALAIVTGKTAPIETTHNTQSNIIDKKFIKPNYYINGSNGQEVYASGLSVTDFCPIEGGVSYYYYSIYGGYCAFYDQYKTYISGYGQRTASDYLSSPFTTPANAKYARFTIVSGNVEKAWICKYNKMSEPPKEYATALKVHIEEDVIPTEYDGTEISVFNKILCIGDSLTDGFFNENRGSRLIIRKYAYPSFLQKISGVECVNKGYAGYTSKEWYEAHASESMSGFDACIIQLGVNDGLRDISTVETTEAFRNIINKIKSENANIKIFVSTILPANSYMTAKMRNEAELIRTIVENINDENVFLVDLWKYGHTNDELAYDSGHLSALGYLRLAEDYKAYISYIINKNKMKFRFVQFVGTSYSYNANTHMTQL